MDFYVILGLEHGATESDIKRAYRRLARRYHPDINPGDRMAELRFQQILEAYETLIDPTRRSRYEAGQGPPPEAEPHRSGFEGFDFSVQGSDHAVTFGDLFAEVLTERGGRQQPQTRGADLHQEVVLSFEEAYAGVSKPVSLTRRESCRTCAGTGVARGSGASCLVCHGAGSVRSVRGHMVFSRRCTACGGSGQQRPVGCEPCGGTGQAVRAETIYVAIPAGVADGERVRVDARGDGGLHGGAAGDLYLTIRVASHAVFRRDGRDVHVVVGVAVHEAALGARIEVPAPDGRARLRVPPGTQSGQRFRLRERGMPSLRGETRGDLIVEVHLRLPAILDERSKELLREFGRLNGEGERTLSATPDTEVRPIIVGGPGDGLRDVVGQGPEDQA